jgi:large subunit ribosomal protein L21
MDTYAIIETGGKQLHVKPGRFYDTPLAFPVDNSVNQNAKIVFSRILLVRHKDITLIGKPWIENATIKGRVLHSWRDEKVTIYNMRPKKKTRKKQGHRQPLVRWVIDDICVDNKTIL